MKILFDCRYTRIGLHDGVSRFTAGLVAALSELHPVTMVVSDERQLAMLPDLPWVKGPSPTKLREAGAARYFNRYQPDVVYTPMQTMGPWGRRFRLVTTVHDLIYYTHRTPPRTLPLVVRGVWFLYHLSWAPQRGLLRQADAHVTVSETTRQLMIQHRMTPHPISVVPNGVAASQAVRARAPAGRELVYMGSFMPYKNVDLLARGLQLLPGYRLHLLSRISESERARITRLAPTGSLQFHNGVSDAEYQKLLARSSALVSASRDEGFGLPLVEAMGAGTPVVVSDIPIFREIGTDAAVYFDPGSPESFAAAVRSIEPVDEWTRRSERSVERSEHFHWERSAEALLEALRAVCATPHR